MAPLPQSNTARYWLIYNNNGTTHRMMTRVAPGTTPAAATAAFNGLFAALSGILKVTTVLGMEVAGLGSNVRNPATYSGGTTWGLGTDIDTDRRASMLSFVGRSPDGRKTRAFVFGINTFGEGDMRVDISESAAIDNAVTLLNDSTAAWFSISGVKPIWRSYVNLGYNDHWIKEYRKGG